MELAELYSDIINEHSRNPGNRRQLINADAQKRGHNPSCGDDITLSVSFDGDVIADAAFTGVGCAISQASADILSDLIIGKTVSEAKTLTEKFLAMIKRENTDDADLADLDEALALKNIANMPARVKCAVLAWRTLNDILTERQSIS